MHRPAPIHGRYIDDERRRMRFPVRFEHFPTAWNHTLTSILSLARPVGVEANQMGTAHETRREPAAGKTVKLWVTSPNKDAIGRACSRNDLPDNRQKIKRLGSHGEGRDQKAERRPGGSGDD